MTSTPPIVLAVANQKGGVAKTTTVASIGAALAELGHRVLLVDLDPQACLTFSLGVDPEDLELSVHHVLTKGLAPGRGDPRDRGRRRPAAGHDRARPRRGRPADPHRPRARAQGRGRRPGRGGHGVRLDPARLPAVARRADRRGADRRRRACSSRSSARRCRTAAWASCSTPCTTSAGSPTRASRSGACCRRCTTGAPTTRARCSRRSRRPTTSRSIEPPIPKTIKFAEAPARGRSILATSRSSKGAMAYREVAVNLVKRASGTER